MNSWSDEKDFITTKEILDPLLPHAAGAIEDMDVATFTDIKNQIEKDLERKVSDSELVKALEAGVQLGMFKMNREFKVCREFTTKEIKKLKHMKNNLMAANTIKKFRVSKREKNLMDFVRNERERRRKKLNSRKKGRGGNIKNLKYDCLVTKNFLCTKCRNKAKKNKVVKKKSSTESIKDLRKTRLSRFNMGSETSTSSSSAATYDPNKADNSEEEETPKKSNLLIQKNSMETKPPYCDIFT